MLKDYAKKERAFLDALKTDTGHALETWLEMIDAELLEERNDIIDWLRQHGFTFSRASWIERIHHNGGQPIYANANTAPRPPTVTDEPPARLENPVSVAHPDRKDAGNDPSGDAGTTQTPHENNGPNKSPTKPKPKLRVVASNSGPKIAKPNPADAASTIEQTLAKAKGLRPLAQHIVTEIKTVVPDVKISVANAALVFTRTDTPFGLLALSAKDLRLGLALTSGDQQPPFEAPHFMASHARISQNMTHMLVLDDVRQITPAVLSGVQKAANRA